MREYIILLIIIFLAAAPLPSHAEYRQQITTEHDSGLEFTLSSPLSKAPPFGYFPLHLTIRNNYPFRRSWRIHTSTSFPSAHLRETSDYQESVTAEPMENKSVWLMIPIQRQLVGTSHSGTEIFVKIEGDDITGGSAYIPGTQGEVGSPSYYNSALFNDSMNSLLGGFESNYKDTFNAHFSHLLEFSSDWRGYSGLNSVWLQPHEWNELSESQQQALLEWIFQGGNLFISTIETHHGSNEKTSVPPTAPENDEGAGKENENQPKRDIKLLETTDFEHLPSALRKRLGNAVLGSKSGWQFGLGEIHQVKLPAITSSECIDSIVAYINRNESDSFFQRLTHPENIQLINTSTYSIEKIPEAGLLMIIILYTTGLCIVPTKILRNRQKRYLLFVAIPLLSCCTCIVILLTILLADGVGGKGVQVALAALLPNDSHQALIIQDQTVKMGSLWSRNFSLPQDVAFSEIPIARHSPGNCPVTSNQNQRILHASRTTYSGDYFRGRSVLSHSFQRFSFLRGGIELRGRGNNREIVEARSTLPVPVDRLWLSIEGKQYAGRLNPSGQWSSLSTEDVSAIISTIPGFANNAPQDNPLKSTLIGRFAQFKNPDPDQTDAWIAVSNNPSDILLQTHPSIAWEDRHLVLVGTTFDVIGELTEGSKL